MAKLGLWALISLHDGASVKEDGTTKDGGDPALFNTKDEAEAFALRLFGESAGKDYDPKKV
jgi:hypothetical protein